MKSSTFGWRVLLTVVSLPFVVWGVASLYYGTGSCALCLALAIIYGVGHFILLRFPDLREAFLFCVLWYSMLPLAFFLLAQPSHDRDWQPDVARMPRVAISNNEILVFNVRNCDYVSETNFTVRYEDRTYDLNQLTSVDVIFSDWGWKHVVHTMLSFGFGNTNYLCLSVETRKEKGESYSALRGFFRQYELIGIIADERDVIRLRTNYRKGETVSLYRLRLPSKEQAQRQLLAFLNAINRLNDTPTWYNALTDNCMTSVFRLWQKNAIHKQSLWNRAVIFNGYMPEWMYREGSIDNRLPIEEMKTRSIVNARAKEADQAADFSVLIREGLPGIDWVIPTNGSTGLAHKKSK
jgi:hypothetical protein